ncbi:hypothetical protein V8B97DRAFT_2025401 [Scleroderma yunnanense]
MRITVWVTHEVDIQEGLCCGTGLGYLIIWRQQPNGYFDFEEVISKKVGTSAEIMAISADTTNSVIQLMAGTRDHKYHLSNIFNIQLPTTVPHVVFFQGGISFSSVCTMGNHTLHGKDSTILQSKGTRMMIGAAAMDSNSTHFVIDNATISFSLHCMDDTACIKMYDTKSLKTYPKQVTFAEKGRAIVGSSDNRIVHIFNKVNGDLLQLLQHSKSGQVQTIAVS